MKTFAKLLSVLVVLPLLGLIGWYSWITRDHAPTHSALVDAPLAPLISVQDFWANPNSEWGYSLSPEGTYMSWWKVDGVNQLLMVQNRQSGKIQTIRPEPGQTAEYGWSYDDRHLFLIQFRDDRKSVWKIDAQNVDTEWKEVTPRGFRTWRSSYRPKSADERRLISTHDRNSQFQDLYSIDQDGFGKTLLRTNPGNVIWWSADRKGDVFLRKINTAPGQFELQYDAERNDTSWRSLVQFTSRMTFYVLEGASGEEISAISNVGRDQIAAVKINLTTGEETIVLEDPDRSVEQWYSFNSEKPEMDILLLGGGYPIYHATTPLGVSVLNAAKETLTSPDAHFNLETLSSTKNGQFVTLAVNEEENGWYYLLVNTETGVAEEIASHAFRQHASSFAETIAHTIPARDGLNLPILLTRPIGVDKPAPMVVLVHGGPMNHDRWYFGRYVQFLANRGYAVLRVNYRGSTGHGLRFQLAGDHEYGRGMQDDIQDATQWAIDQGIADKEAVAIMGHSFGGYSAMMGVAQEQDLYSVGISLAGALDLEYLTTHSPHFWGVDQTYWTQVIGDPENPDHISEMQKYSPINFVDQINVPVLIAHGVNDSVVDRADTERLERKLREFAKPYEAYYFEKEDHVFRRWQTNVRLFRRLEDFLALHLGGRSGGFDDAEIGAEYLYP